MFSSSEPVTATTSSVSRAPASRRVWMEAPLPSTHIRSRVLSATCMASARWSMRTSS